MFTGELDEVDSAFRATGNPPKRKVEFSGGTGTQFPYRHIPICFARAYDLQSEIPGQLSQGQEDYPAVLVLEVISKDRTCPKRNQADGFTRWHQGFTPKEHREMLDRQWVLDFEAREHEKDRTWREEQRRLDLEWRAEQEEKAEGRHDEQLGTLKQQHKWQLLVLGFLVTVAIVASTIVGAMIGAGWIKSPW